MKKILLTAVIAALGTVASFGQGQVSIANATATFYISTNTTGNVSGRAGGTGATAYYYELLISANSTLQGTANNIYGNSGNFALWSDSTVTGVSGAAGLNAGKITAANPATATGWALPGVAYDNAYSYIVVGWSGNYGTTWSAVSSLIQSGSLAAGGYFGTSAVAVNYAGGGTANLPTVILWGNQTSTSGFGLASGFLMNQVAAVPEPSTLVLAGLGGLSLLAFRRKK